MTLKIIAKIATCFIAAVVALCICGVMFINSSSVQNKIMKRATMLLSEQLETRVEIDKIDISLFKQSLDLYGLLVEDREKRPMLRMERLSIDLNLTSLLRNRVVVEKAEINGLSALLQKPDDGPANFQFVIDAFSKKKSDEPREKKQEKKQPIDLDVTSARLKNVDLRYNDYSAKLQDATFSTSWLGSPTLDVKFLEAAWDSETKKGIVANFASIDEMVAKIRKKKYDVSVQGLHYKTDNHLPRKNANKPKHGFFDLGHLDVTANLQLSIDSIAKDTLIAELVQFEAQDSVMGFDIQELKAKINTDFTTMKLQSISLQQKNTILEIEEGSLVLPSKKKERKLSYSTGTIVGRTMLQDISRVFAPALSNFTIPLNFKVKMSGTDETIAFKDIEVKTDDKRLQIFGIGNIKNLKDKEMLDISFKINQMRCSNKTANDIINQFTVKKLMMKQFRNLGSLSYIGNVAILWKKEKFDGHLMTDAGSLDFEFALDEKDKYITGKVKSTGFQIGEVMDMDDLGDVICQADFKVDFSKTRTAQMRRQKGGNLPICTVNAKVEDCSYGKIHIRNLTMDLDSDGAVAEGKVWQHGKRRDLYCSFSFTDTDDMRKMKIKSPGIKFHGLSDADKEAKEKEKAQKAMEKEAKKAAKEAEKEAKAAEKAAKKEAKAAEKEAKKEAKKAAKEAEREAKKSGDR